MKIERTENSITIKYISPECIKSISKYAWGLETARIDASIANYRSSRPSMLVHSREMKTMQVVWIKTKHGLFMHINADPTYVYKKLNIDFTIVKSLDISIPICVKRSLQEV